MLSQNFYGIGNSYFNNMCMFGTTTMGLSTMNTKPVNTSDLNLNTIKIRYNFLTGIPMQINNRALIWL